MSSGDAAPTFESLSAMLGQHGRVQTPPLVLLKAGGANPPIFVAHGLGGNVLGLFQLAQKLQLPNPVYGVQAKGLDGFDEPQDQIEGMAEFHRDAIQQLQRHGPYFLIGYSLGGLVMLEVARHLLIDGEKIGLLVMLDSYPERRHLRFAQRARLVCRLAWHRAASLLGAGKHVDQIKAGGSTAPSDEAAARAMKRVTDAQYRAWRSYRPEFYDGKIKFVRAANCSFLPNDPVAVWAHLASEFESETVPGEHVGMLTAHVDTLAATLSQYAKHALGAG